MQLFYTPDIAPHLKSFVLSEEESRHAVRVLRMEAGQQVQLVDGRGGLYTAVIVDAHPKRSVLEILRVETRYGTRPYYLHVAIAPTKQIERIEWFLEKATEVGIDEITPIICERSERKEVKVERLNKVMAAAMKQSLKAYIPRMNEPLGFGSFLDQRTEGQRFIAHCGDGDKQYLSEIIEPAGRYTVLIGPEGDFSGAEVDAAQRAGFFPVTFGASRLRTETAALVACLEAAIRNRRY